MKYLLIITLLFSTGCTQLGDLIEKGAKAHDEALEASIFGVCALPTVNAYRRKFDTPEEAKAVNEFCRSQGYTEVKI